MNTELRLRPVLLLASLIVPLAVACGDSGSGGGGGAVGGGSSTGAGNTGGDTSTGAGNTGGSTTTVGGGGQGTGGGPTCTEPGTNIPTGECDLVLQNCPVPTDTCTVVNGDMSGMTFMPTTGCVTYNGLKGVGESCMQENDCQAHLNCVGNTCSPYCCPGADAACMGGTCDLNINLVDNNNNPTMCGAEPCTFTACSYSASCNLFDPNACPPTENCYFKSAGLATCATPAPPGEQPDGAPCSASNACGESTLCISSDGTNYFCHYLCQVGSNAAPSLGGCPAGQLCDTNGFDTGFANVGYCHN